MTVVATTRMRSAGMVSTVRVVVEASQVSARSPATAAKPLRHEKATRSSASTTATEVTKSTIVVLEADLDRVKRPTCPTATATCPRVATATAAFLVEAGQTSAGSLSAGTLIASEAATAAGPTKMVALHKKGTAVPRGPTESSVDALVRTEHGATSRSPDGTAVAVLATASGLPTASGPPTSDPGRHLLWRVV